MKLCRTCWLTIFFFLVAITSLEAQSRSSIQSVSAESWLGHLAPAPQLPGLTYSLQKDLLSLTGRHLTWQAFYQEKPIFDTQLKAHISLEGELWAAHQSLPSDLQAPRARAAWAHDTRELSAQFSQHPTASRVHTQAGWMLQQQHLIPVYKTERYQWAAVHAEAFLLDASTLDTLAHRDLGVYHHAAVDTPGIGRIFWPDPCTKASVTYGTDFSDAMDQHLPIFDSLMDTVVLQDIRFEDGLFHLDGPYVSVRDLAPFTAPPVTSPDSSFFFQRNEAGFEEVMVYFHIDTFQRYVQRLGFTNLQNGPLRVDAHGLGNSDQSAFIPNNGNPYLLFGDGGVDDAEDADVIIHEYIHALSEAASGSNNGLERRGLDEGLADYFAAGYSYDLSLWNWYELYNWDGHNEFWSGRMAVSTESYPPGSTGIYGYGQLWASVLMELRQEIGAETMDRLVLESLYYNVENMQLPQAAHQLLVVDSMLYAGVHLELLRNKLCSRNLLSGADCLSVANETLQPTRTLQVYLDESGSHLALQHLPVAQGRAEIRLFSINGQLLQTWTSRVAQQNVPLHHPLAKGLYIVHVSGPGQPLQVRKIRRL